MAYDYPYLPEGRKIKYVSISDPFIIAAKKCMQEQSTDRKHPTGAVVVKDGKIITSAANKSRLKKEWQFRIHAVFCIRRLLRVKSGTKYYLCPGCASSKMHAEARASRELLSKNKDISNADIYLWGHWWCCKPCWDAMIAAGIKDVYLVEGAPEKFKR